MRKVIGAVLLFAALYFIQQSFLFTALSGLIQVGVLLSFLYLVVSVLQYLVPLLKKPAVTNATPQNISAPVSSPKKASSSGWFVAVIATGLLIFFFREMLGRLSYGVFLYLDNLVKISQSLPPFVCWGLLGVLVGAIYGSFVAWKKYRLHYTVNLVPIAVLALAVAMLIIINEPSGNNMMAEAVPGYDSTELRSPEELIINRWEIVDLTGKNRKNFLRQKKNRKSELEFRNNGKCYMYENGVTTQFVYYMVSSDGKSMEFTDPRMKNDGIKFEIISISPAELKLKSSMFGNGIATLTAN